MRVTGSGGKKARRLEQCVEGTCRGEERRACIKRATAASWNGPPSSTARVPITRRDARPPPLSLDHLSGRPAPRKRARPPGIAAVGEVRAVEITRAQVCYVAHDVAGEGLIRGGTKRNPPQGRGRTKLSTPELAPIFFYSRARAQPPPMRAADAKRYSKTVGARARGGEGLAVHARRGAAQRRCRAVRRWGVSNVARRAKRASRRDGRGGSGPGSVWRGVATPPLTKPRPAPLRPRPSPPFRLGREFDASRAR